VAGTISLAARHWLAAAAVLLGVAVAKRAEGQTQSLIPPMYSELRADAIVARETAAQVGAGVVMPLGIYVRLSVDAAGGATFDKGASRASGRVDAIGRFLLDPFRETPVAVSFGGGLSVPYVDGQDHLRPYLTAVIDIEGRKRGRFTPAFQIGLGGGARVGIVLRTSQPRWR
jgi:hypothetical protein